MGKQNVIDTFNGKLFSLKIEEDFDNPPIWMKIEDIKLSATS
jgi:hypothetical protein